MNVHQLDAYTREKFGFRVFDWDQNRGKKDGAGSHLVWKYDFNVDRTSENCEKYDITQKDISLDEKTLEQVGEIFNAIFVQHKDCVVKGMSFKATSLHLRLGENDKIQERPFIFVMGFPVET
jgi:hypothetical protein